MDEEKSTFEKELVLLINCHCVENGSNTPDFILGQYMIACLKAFDSAVQRRELWHGREPKPAHTRYGVDFKKK